jgi:PiT family inorganic phosphate transporter
MAEPTLILTIIAALGFSFITGFHDAANAIATSVLTRALSIRNAILMAAGLNMLGGLISVRVATTIGAGIVYKEFVNPNVVLAALIGAVTWNLITWRLGLPSSSTHAIVGGVVGAAAAGGTAASLQSGTAYWQFPYHMYQSAGLTKVLLGLIISPPVGLLTAWLFMVLLYHIFGKVSPSKLNRPFRRLQVLSAGFMAFSHGTNDAQLSMGIVTMALVTAGLLPAFTTIPYWVKMICAAFMAFGTAAGGWRIIKTIGRNLMELQPIHGFAAETSAATVIQICTHLGAPISTTHVISSAIMGVGVSRRLSAVRWGVVGNIVGAWIMTMPMAGLMAAIAYCILGWLNPAGLVRVGP